MFLLPKPGGKVCEPGFFPVLFRLLYEDTSSTRGTGGPTQKQPSIPARQDKQGPQPLRRMTGRDRVRPRLSNSGAGTNGLRSGSSDPFFLFQFCPSGADFLGHTRLRPQKAGSGKARDDKSGRRAGVEKIRTNVRLGAGSRPSAFEQLMRQRGNSATRLNQERLFQALVESVSERSAQAFPVEQ